MRATAFRPLLLLAAGSVVTACGAASNPREPLDRYLDIPIASEEPLSSDGDWLVQHFDPSTGALCLKGTPYQTAWRAGTNNNVILFLEGGGACWDDVTCSLDRAEKVPHDPPAEGMLDRTAMHALSSWHVLYAPYCDGSIFGGDNDMNYAMSGEIRHHGIQNASAAISSLRRHVPNPDRILLAGQSAGGFGTLMTLGPLRKAFPSTPIFVLDDSGPGALNGNDRLLIYDIRAHWKLDGNLPEACTDCDPQLTPAIAFHLGESSFVRRFGLFSYYEDGTIGTHFLRMRGADYRRMIVEETGKVSEQEPDRFKRFFLNGSDHTIIGKPEYFTTKLNGVTVSQWVDEMVTDDPDWSEHMQ